MRRLVEHANGTRSVLLQWTIKHQKSTKLKIPLNLISGQLINLPLTTFRETKGYLFNRHILLDESPSETQDTRTLTH